ncbi:MAG: hypothetical protein A2351_03415 [Omnitrophica bacterium RIFOXYB12_FULL_50_7]|nr:MAG: hypothetical protein A2351_03415 [Omnitrophica bacterium RIFOXYB12_FULL_50_7]
MCEFWFFSFSPGEKDGMRGKNDSYLSPHPAPLLRHKALDGSVLWRTRGEGKLAHGALRIR